MDEDDLAARLQGRRQARGEAGEVLGREEVQHLREHDEVEPAGRPLRRHRRAQERDLRAVGAAGAGGIEGGLGHVEGEQAPRSGRPAGG